MISRSFGKNVILLIYFYLDRKWLVLILIDINSEFMIVMVMFIIIGEKLRMVVLIFVLKVLIDKVNFSKIVLILLIIFDLLIFVFIGFFKI